MTGLHVMLSLLFAATGLNQPGSIGALPSSAIAIDLSWQDTSSTETGFEIDRSATGANGAFSLVATTAANTTTYSDTGLNASTEYCYKLRSFKTGWGKTTYSTFSTVACATTLAPPTPAAPSNTSALTVSDTRIDVGWQDNSTNETGFELQRSNSGPTGAFSLLSSTGAGVVAASDTGLAPATQYCYRVRAFDTSGGKTSYSDPSATACATTAAPSPPAAPTNTRVYSVSYYRLDIYWQDNSSSETAFEVHRSGDGPAGPFALVSSTAANATSATDLNVTASTQYCYKVRAFTAGIGYSDFSDTACATTGAPPGLYVTTATMGQNLPTCGYQADIWRDDVGSRLYITSIALPMNGTVTVPDLLPNTDYFVDFVGAPLNCRLTSPAGQDVHLGGSWDPGVTVEFDVDCAPPMQLAFATTNGPAVDIWVINVDGTGAAALTADPAYAAAPTWSPDGTKIAFESGRNGASEIYVMNADGSNPVQITSTGASFRPAWSPDGTKIAFTSYRDGNEEIYVVNADGSGLVNLTNDPGDDGDPAWSPDGARIAFRSNRDNAIGFTNIYLMNADGSGVMLLNDDPGVSDSQPSWSPDGQQLAVARYWCGEWCLQTVWAMSVLDGSAHAISAVWNPDCEWLGEPAWSPDGSQIAMTETNMCWGGNTVKVSDVPLASGSNPSWRRP